MAPRPPIDSVREWLRNLNRRSDSATPPTQGQLCSAGFRWVDATKAGMPTTLQTARCPATKTIAGTALPAAARAYRPTTGRTVGSIIAAIMATQAMRNAASDIVARYPGVWCRRPCPGRCPPTPPSPDPPHPAAMPSTRSCPQSPVWLAVAHVASPIGRCPGDDDYPRPNPPQVGWAMLGASSGVDRSYELL